MISKNKIKQLRQYHQKKQRDADSVFFVEGTKLTQEALRSGFAIREIIAQKSWIQSQYNIPFPITEAEDEELKKISLLKTAPEVWTLIERKETKTSNNKTGAILVLDDIQDPGNMGTILRTADWFGISCIVCSPHCVDIYNPKVVQASMGAIFRVPVVISDISEYLTQSELPVYGAFLEGQNIFTETIPKNAILVIGNEGNGISKKVETLIHIKVHIPSYAKGIGSESLNAGVAAAIICAEYRRKHMNK